MERLISRQGWIVIFGVPALFVSAYVIASSPALIGLPLCAVKMFLGIDCPGCGLTRSIAFLTHGEVRRSIDLHPLGIVIALWLTFVFFRQIAGMVSARMRAPLLSNTARHLLLGAFVIAIFSQWIIKLFFSFSL